MKKVTSGSIETRIARFLFSYRITPHTTTGVSPAELLMGRRLRSQLDLVRPNVRARVETKQQAQKKNHDKRTKQRELKVADHVYVRDFPGGKTWLPGSIVSCRGPLSFIVRLRDGRCIRRHIDHICLRTVEMSTSRSTLGDWTDDLVQVPSTSVCTPSTTTNGDHQNVEINLRRSTRNRRAPDRFSN